MRTQALSLAALLLVSTLFARASQAQVPTFHGVGDLPSGAVGSAALDISADGSVVVGESEGANGTEAFRWTQGGGITGLGFLSLADPYSTATGISADGTVISGSSNDASGVIHAYRWSASTMTALNTQSCDSCDPVTIGYGISGDGLVVVGSSAARGGGLDPLRLDAVRWAGGGTSLSDLGNLSGGEEVGEALGASSTGSVITGHHMTGNGKEAFYWSGSGLNLLPTITGGAIIVATGFAVSDDASTIVGFSNQGTVTLPGGTVVATDLQAVRWTGASFSTLEQLGALPGAVTTDSRALAVSSDGSIIVGQAVDASLSNRAFIWDSVNGMRNLKTLLVDQYGLDLTAWVLSEATGISNVVGGEFSIVGRGINPQGEEEGWLAFLTEPACSDGVNNDLDVFTDYPDDPECLSASDWSEEHDCADGIDNDGDGNVDFPLDLDCLAIDDPTEEPDCSDGIDNDADTFTDYPDDAGCANADSQLEDPACSDGVDNDTDLATDYPADAECLAASDLSEVPDCADSLDNDGDGQTDFPADTECADAADLSEAGECADGIDNDANGKTDYPDQYPGCVDADDPIEAAQCGDGVDNDGDTNADYPADLECASLAGVSESPVSLTPGGLIVVDRSSRAVFRVDTGTGVQTLISEKALMQEPQGVAIRAFEIVVADPAGLIAVSETGEQRLASGPLASHESLQVMMDRNGDAFVLEETGISKVVWNELGVGTKSTYFDLPTPEPIPVLELWWGDAMAFEPNDDIAVTGFSLYGDGVYHIDATTQAASILLPGFDSLKWLDIALEDYWTILAVGYKYDQATGIYRVDRITGVATALNNTYGWQMPTGVAVDASGEIFVADAGVCADGVCTGGQIVHVDPVGGAATQIASGGNIAGEMDLVFVPEPDRLLSLLSGCAALALMNRARRHAANG